MEKEFVSYKQAVALKELGFNEQCFAWHNSKRLYIESYDNYNSKMPFEYCCSLPIKQQVFKFFRDKYDLIGYVEKLICGSFEDVISSPHLLDWEDDITYSTYEEAEENCINRLIEIAKQQNNGK